jgi:hypothetical protein
MACEKHWSAVEWDVRFTLGKLVMCRKVLYAMRLLRLALTGYPKWKMKIG